MANQQNVLDLEIIKLLTLVVALSMMLTPILMIILDKLIMPNLLKITDDKEADIIDNDNNPTVIIAGYGRFGQGTGRLLKANGIQTTILDNNSDHIETLRKFGHKVYYGDASRLDLLETAGIKSAKAIIITLADKQKSMLIVNEIKQNFPDLKIFVRAINRQHAYQLIEIGVNDFERDVFHSAVLLGEKVLISLGFHPYRAKRAAKIFKKHDYKVIKNLYTMHKENHTEYIVSSKEEEINIAEMLKADMAGVNSNTSNDYSWSAILSEKDINKVITDNEH